MDANVETIDVELVVVAQVLAITGRPFKAAALLDGGFVEEFPDLVLHGGGLLRHDRLVALSSIGASKLIAQGRIDDGFTVSVLEGNAGTLVSASLGLAIGGDKCCHQERAG